MKRNYHYLLNGQLIRISSRSRPSAKTIPKCGVWSVLVMDNDGDFITPHVFSTIDWPNLINCNYLGSAELDE